MLGMLIGKLGRLPGSRIKGVFVLYGILACGFGAVAQADVSADWAALKSYQLEHFQGFSTLAMGHGKSADLRLLNLAKEKLSDVRTERIIRHEETAQGLMTRDRVLFRSGKLRGTAIVVEARPLEPSQYRMWLPALRKVRRFTEPALNDVWAGTQLTYGDIYMRRPSHETHHWQTHEPRPLGCLTDIIKLSPRISERVEHGLSAQGWCAAADRPVVILRSQPQYAGAEYDYRLRTLDAESYAEYRVEFIQNNRVIKRFEKAWYEPDPQHPRQWLWKFWSVWVKSPDGLHESLAWVPEQSVQINPTLKPSLWSDRALRKIKR